MKKFYFIIIIIMLLCITTGCKRSIVGKWKTVDNKDDYYYLFNRDKTCSYEMNVARLDCKYEVEGDNLKILFNGNKNANSYKYHFKGKYLIISDSTGKERKFIKKK